MTDQPLTLLQMAGADLTPVPLSEAALVLIDCQNEYVDGRLALPGAGPALAEAGALLARARAAGTPVLHVVHQGAPGGPFDPEGRSGAIADAVAAAEGEAVVRKRLPNAFAGTDLQALLGDTGRRQLLLVGFMTHMCVSATARAALDLGWRSTIVAAACATRALPDPLGGPALAPEALHRAALAALADRFAIIAPTQADIPD